MTRFIALTAVLAILAPAVVRSVNQAIHDQLHISEYRER